MSQASKSSSTILQLALLLGIIIIVNILANVRLGNQALYGYLDLTEEKRFTLTDGTRELLRELDDVVTIEILLDGPDLPADYKKLRESVIDLLEDFRNETGLIEYQFTNPAAGSVEEVRAMQDELAKQGIFPKIEQRQGADQMEVKLIYPYAKFFYKGRPAAINFLENQVPGMDDAIVLENSIGLLEYKFANIIQKLQSPFKPNILFTTGHGELNQLETADLEQSLRAFYNVGRINLDDVVTIDQEAAALIVAKPRGGFSERDKFKIDQYVMNGGKVMWLLDALRVDLDSLRRPDDYVPIDYKLNLEDLLFRYGIRIQPNMVLDWQCSSVPVATGRVGNAPQLENFRYPYHPVILPTIAHPIVKSLDAINLFYPSTIDTTIRTKTPVKKTVLLQTSPKTRLQYIPVRMNFDFVTELQEDKFNKGPQVVAMLLEGVFPSRFENRLTPEMEQGLEELGMEFKAASVPSRMIVVSDGDIAKNKVDYEKKQFAPLGYNEYVKYQFANKEFLINSLEYLLDERGLIEARGKEVKLRLLNDTKAKQERLKWQLINIVLPIVFVVLFGIGYRYWRRWRYAN